MIKQSTHSGSSNVIDVGNIKTAKIGFDFVTSSFRFFISIKVFLYNERRDGWACKSGKGPKIMKIINKMISALFKINRWIKLFTQPLRYLGRSLTFKWLRKFWRFFKLKKWLKTRTFSPEQLAGLRTGCSLALPWEFSHCCFPFYWSISFSESYMALLRECSH